MDVVTPSAEATALAASVSEAEVTRDGVRLETAVGSRRGDR
jgi:hypothetical protein